MYVYQHFYMHCPNLYAPDETSNIVWRTCKLAIWRLVCLVSCGLVFQCPNFSYELRKKNTDFFTLKWFQTYMPLCIFLSYLLLIHTIYAILWEQDTRNTQVAQCACKNKMLHAQKQSSMHLCIYAWANSNPVCALIITTCLYIYTCVCQHARGVQSQIPSTNQMPHLFIFLFMSKFIQDRSWMVVMSDMDCWQPFEKP